MEDISIFAVITACGLVIFLITYIMLAKLAFKKNLWWGLGFTAIPVVGLVYLAQYWSNSKKTTIAHLVSIVLTLGGYQITEGF